MSANPEVYPLDALGDLVFTDHALERVATRGVSEAAVVSALRHAPRLVGGIRTLAVKAPLRVRTGPWTLIVRMDHTRIVIVTVYMV